MDSGSDQRLRRETEKVRDKRQLVGAERLLLAQSSIDRVAAQVKRSNERKPVLAAARELGAAGWPAAELLFALRIGMAEGTAARREGEIKADG